jgi:hypothetical protein
MPNLDRPEQKKLCAAAAARATTFMPLVLEGTVKMRGSGLTVLVVDVIMLTNVDFRRVVYSTCDDDVLSEAHMTEVQNAVRALL